MTDFAETLAARPFPVTLTPRWGPNFGLGMGILGGMGGILLASAGIPILLDKPEDPEVILGMLAAGLFLTGFPIYWIWTCLRGWPRLRIDAGRVEYTNPFGRRERLVLGDHARVAIVNAPGRGGYRPRLEAVPTAPGLPLRMISLRPFLRNRHEAAELEALIHRAAGDRPAPDLAQRNVILMQDLKAIVVTSGALVLVVIGFGVLRALGRI
ncbi:MAG: hypothetical protein AB7U46_12335 [Paenirhodobacter sp.]|uniref:hypothetical protein n=1 Tax=Paenirhodobacter sp. TaxID=1965326 RepID=UPI003D09AA84